MGAKQVKAWVCDECQHVWIAGDKKPTHCASSKCRSRSWDSAPKLNPKVSLPDTPKVRKMARRFNESVLATVQGNYETAKQTIHRAMMNHVNHDPATCRVYRCGICAVAKESKA